MPVPECILESCRERKVMRPQGEILLKCYFDLNHVPNAFASGT
jgi:hypothetical protein